MRDLSQTLRITGRAELTFHLNTAGSHAPVHAVVRRHVAKSDFYGLSIFLCRAGKIKQ
jgi:hypothetical protein